MKVLVWNVGSTSLKFDLFDMDTEAKLATGTVERIGQGEVESAVRSVAERLRKEHSGLGESEGQLAIGHRVVHGGEHLTAPTRIESEVISKIEACSRFAPLHVPANLAGIRVSLALFPEAPQVAVFDTAFHAHMPSRAHTYALPYELYLQHGIRRYGFHGPSHQFMSLCAARHMERDLRGLRLVTCHLGGGASVAAIEGGVSVDTSMGMTPLEGLMMGTRAGDLDPSIPLDLLRQGRSIEEVERLLNRESGLLGLSGVSSDFRDVEKSARAGDPRARLALDVFVHRVRKYIGAYSAVLGGLDALVFTGGIGENSSWLRNEVCEGLLFMGIALDRDRNVAAHEGETFEVSAPRSPVRVLVVRTDEERMIARDVLRVVEGPGARVVEGAGPPIPVGVSVRHVHLSEADRDALFGKGYELQKRRDVTQPGQYVTRETVDVVGPKGTLAHVGIILPLRAETQIELARTDARTLGIDPPLRESGKLEGTPGVMLRGPKGEVRTGKGAIIAQRHVHMSPENASQFGVRNGDVIQVRVTGDREMVLGDVVVRVSPKFSLDMHVDTDEANAAGLDQDSVVEFVGIQEHGTNGVS